MLLRGLSISRLFVDGALAWCRRSLWAVPLAVISMWGVLVAVLGVFFGRIPLRGVASCG